MHIYKFGGASIATPEKMQALLPIITEVNDPLVLVVSAFGKTTNALEEVVAKACKDKKEDAKILAQQLENVHKDYASALLQGSFLNDALKALNILFTELQWNIDDASNERYDYSYDQIVCMGELMSTTIFAYYLRQSELKYEWIDARDVIRTDDTYRDAKVDENFF